MDLDSDPGSLKVRRTPDTHSTPVYNPPKTELSRRSVALHREAKSAFVAQRAMLKREGTPMKADNLRKRY